MIRHTFPHTIREIENVFIPMPDGAQLAARIWLPVDAEQRPVPALLEYIPYRKGDWTAARDALQHPWFAGHGYASVRVDLRGSGESDGVLLGEYLQQELDDGVAVIAWLAAQPWCNGNVGMFGKSWGGFNALQVAALRPPALKAILTLYSTDDRFTDDIHYIGGANFGSEHVAWATTMLAFNARPPDPRHVGERWRDMWLQRLRETPGYLDTWLQHQRCDAFWQHGSVNVDYAAITCAVYAIGGWADGYTNAVPRLLAGLRCPRLGLIGPWPHQYPHSGAPGPAIGFLQEALRWWDHWLKGADNGIMREPMLRAWLQASTRPQPLHSVRPGRWVGEAHWPPRDSSGQVYLLRPQQLIAHPAPAAADGPHIRSITGDTRCGFDAGVYYSMGAPGDEAPDQYADDALSLCFDAPPTQQPVDLLGFPELGLTLSSNRAQAQLTARLCDVAPDGSSLLVSRGILNLAHRDGHQQPQPLPPDQPVAITLRLKICGHTLLPGHRWRLAISPNYFPWAWPSPELATLTLDLASAQLVLPVRTATPSDAALSPFAQPETASPLPRTELRPFSRQRTLTRDDVNDTLTLRDHFDAGAQHIAASDTHYDEKTSSEWCITAGDPLSAIATTDHTIEMGRPGWRIRISAHCTLTCDATHFHSDNTLRVWEADTLIHHNHTFTHIPRDHA